MSTSIITNMDENARKRIRLIFNPKDHFPSKLYDVCNDGYLIKWNRNGSVSVPDEEAFEAQVLDLYPGFLQIPSFVNLRRLFREYGFEWVINQDNILEFTHHLFVRGRKPLLSEIKTRRKSYQSARPVASSTSEIIEADPGQRYATRKRRRTKHFLANGNTNKPDFQAGGENNGIQNVNQNFNSGIQTQVLPNGIQIIPPNQLQIQKPEVRQPVDMKIIQQNFVQNEFTEEEFMQWLARKRMIEEMKAKENVPETVNKDFVWMYYDNKGERPAFESTKHGEFVLTPSTDESKSDKSKNMEVPCGMCKCCVAMSLLSADSSIVTDDSFMVDLDSDVEVTEIIVQENEPGNSPTCKKVKVQDSSNEKDYTRSFCDEPIQLIQEGSTETEFIQSTQLPPKKEYIQMESNHSLPNDSSLSTKESKDEDFTVPETIKESPVPKEDYAYRDPIQHELPVSIKQESSEATYPELTKYTKIECA